MPDPNPLAHAYAWFECHMGQNPRCSPSYYNAWSGWVSDLGEVTLIAGLFAGARHVNCHVKGCWRPGRRVGDTPYLACHVHHPHHKGDKRNVPHSQIKDAVR